MNRDLRSGLTQRWIARSLISPTAISNPTPTDSWLDRSVIPRPDHGEDSYRGSERLRNKKALITGDDLGIGRAVALAFAREGADVAISYLSEIDDAKETQRLVETAGRKCVLIHGDVGQAAHCRALVQKTVAALGRIDVVVNNAAHQMSFSSIEEISDEARQRTFDTNISAMFYIVKAALPHMPAGSFIINTASINADSPGPLLLPYATTKGAIQNFTGGLAQMLAAKEVPVKAVAPGPVWRPSTHRRLVCAVALSNCRATSARLKHTCAAEAACISLLISA